MTTPPWRIGFACKLIDRPDQINGIKPKDDCRKYNVSSTTVAWLRRQGTAGAEQKLWDLMRSNIESIRLLVERVSTFDPRLRMVRLGSDILPVYTHPDYRYFWRKTDVRDYCDRHFAAIGQIAQQHNVRLSFHPGQFCCIVSETDDIVTRSIEELEYHTDMIRWMGFGQTKLDFKLNVHLSGRRGVSGFDAAWNRMSPELRNCLTLENDEYQQGLDNLLPLSNRVGIVLDIHHHLIKDEEYIAASDPRIQQVIDSWQGRRPVIHYSQSRDEHIGQWANQMPTMGVMLAVAKKAHLRAHSDFYTNHSINHWAASHLDWADIMAECKSKNLGAQQMFECRIAQEVA